MDGMPRRAFLKVAGAAGAALLAGCRTPAAPNATATLGSPSPAHPGGPTTLADVPSEILITSTGDLYTQSYSSTPRVALDGWELVVDGLVQNPARLSYADVLGFPKVQEVRTLECIGNPVGGPLIGNPIWGGFEATSLWSRVGILPEAIRAKFTAADGYQTSVDLEWITQPGVLLVHELNGEPLPAEHGYPLRILMPGLYGQKMPKWITRIEFIAERFQGHWESRGWSDVAAVKTNSIIRQPSDLAGLPAGAVSVFGLAFAGLRRITGVEVRIDQGDWAPAELLQADSSLVWTQWAFAWDASPGRHQVAVRATDEDGFVQSTEASSLLSGAFPDGTDSIHEIVLVVEG